MKLKWIGLCVMIATCAGCATARPGTPAPIREAVSPVPSTTSSPQLESTSTVIELPSRLTATVTPRVASSPTTVMTPAPQQIFVLVGAGDIAGCDSNGSALTADLLDTISGTVFTSGDNAYPIGSATNFTRCYDPTWGRHKWRTRPTPGNHDYATAGAAAYFRYFGVMAGQMGQGYYSYELGQWHIIALNSNCWAVGGCGIDSPQYRWLSADLAEHPARCILAYWHHPRFSSGPHGDSSEVIAFWQVLYQAGADVVLNGHDHIYERFAPQTPSGEADSTRGIREFIVGTGGYSHYAADKPAQNSEVLNTNTFGVLKLTLRPGNYEWNFMPVAGQTFSDSGSASCHTAQTE